MKKNKIKKVTNTKNERVNFVLEVLEDDDQYFAMMNMPSFRYKEFKEELKKIFVSYHHDCYQYSDNYRLARTDREDEMKRYKSKQKNGCCGFFDKEILPGLMFGFNYGH